MEPATSRPKKPRIGKEAVPALYLHFPFCRSICPFCSFTVYPNSRRKARTEYVELLCQEMRYHADTAASKQQIKSLYCGGGTPSLLRIAEVEHILEQSSACFDLTGAQISFEANPEDIHLAYAKQLKDCGINRLSLGVQSFQDSALRVLGRKNTVADNHRALECAKAAGLCVNVDLMFGYKGQTSKQLSADLAALLDWQPEHVSVYCLTPEPGTPVFRDSSWKAWQTEHEQDIAADYHQIIATLQERGILQYEVSNFARAGQESRQNLLNWDAHAYLAFGAGAHSYLAGRRWANFRDYAQWKASVEQQTAETGMDVQFCETLSIQQQLDEHILINLRRREGLVYTQLERIMPSEHMNKDYKSLWQNKVQFYAQHGLIQNANETSLQLSPAGLLLADHIATELSALLEEH